MEVRRRLWLFRLIATGLSLLPLVVLEIGLRVLGFGHDTRLVVPVTGDSGPGTHRLNPSTDRAYYGPLDLQGPEPRSFVLPKPKELYRILVVGGSSVAGTPYPFELALPRQLQVVLEQQSPDRQFEVLNAGITAINTLSEVDIVRQGIACEPDLIIVHSGHNEFYGPGGAASTASAFAPRFHPLLQVLRRLKLVHVCASLVQRPVKRHPQESLPADIAIPRDGPVFARALESYEAHLREMSALAARTGIPLLLTTVPCNVRDQSPMHSLSRTDLTEQQERQQAERWKAAVKHLSYRRCDEALAALRASRELDPANALLAYREAQCLEMLGRAGEAIDAYVLAADLDGCRFRAPSVFQAAVERVASEGGDTVLFCDVAGRLRDQSRLGEDVFFEHVHYNLEGNWRVALILGKFIQEQLLHAEWRRERIPDGKRRDALLGVTHLDHLAADTFALMMVDAWPLNLAADGALQAERIKARLRLRYAALSPLDRAIFTDLSLDAIQQDLLGAMAGAYRAAGREDLAREMVRLRRLRRPWENDTATRGLLSSRSRWRDTSPESARSPRPETHRPVPGPGR